jgi:hypothetical protein
MIIVCLSFRPFFKVEVLEESPAVHGGFGPANDSEGGHVFGAVVSMFLDAFLRQVFMIFFLLVHLELNVCKIVTVHVSLSPFHAVTSLLTDQKTSAVIKALGEKPSPFCQKMLDIESSVYYYTH